MKPIEKTKNTVNSKLRSNAKNKKNKKTRAELNEEARKQKKLKNRKGNPAGSRHHDDVQNGQKKGAKAPIDPRLGSKVKIDLSQYEQLTESVVPVVAVKSIAKESIGLDAKEKLALNKELVKLESSPRLEKLLELLDADETISEADDEFVNVTLDRISELYELLGIELEEEEQEVIEPNDDPLDARIDNDLLRILKS